MDERGDHLVSAEQAKIARKKLDKLLGKTLIGKLDDDDVEEFVEDLQEDGLSIGYISRILSTLRAALNFAVKKKRLKYAPKIPEVRTKAHMDAEPLRGRRLTVEEVAKLFDAAQEPHVLIYLAFLSFTLSRPCALLDLTHKQIDWDHANLNLNPEGRVQTKKHRPTLRIARTFFLWLGWAIKQSSADGHLIHYNGEPIASMKQAFRGLVKRAKLEGRVSAYSIRHTISAYLRKCDPRVPGDEISIVLGHLVVDSKKVTQRYSPFDPDYLVHITPAIEKFFLEVAALCKRHNLLQPGERL
jgi:integrase